MQETSRIRIANIPSETGADAVVARITELLPGVVFDAKRRGAFKRAHYTLEFEVADNGRGVDVSLDHADGFTALKRLAEKTGWEVLDAEESLLIDLDASIERGAVVLVLPGSAEPSAADDADAARSPWLRPTVAAAGIVALLWFAWLWSRRAPSIQVTSSTTTSEVPAAPGNSPSSPAGVLSKATSSDKAGAQRIAQQILTDGVQRMRTRMEQAKLLAPEFRGDPIVQQMLDYQAALHSFNTSTPETRVLKPERLADPSLLPSAWPTGLLPPVFGQPSRDGYLFDAQGTDCDHVGEYLQHLDDFCTSIVYVATPAQPAPGRRAFAYFTADDRIHYRNDGQAPTRDDGTVDNTTPSSAADAAPGAPALLTKAPGTKEEASILARLSRAIQAAAHAAGFATAEHAAADYRESDVVNDFRAFFAAEMTVTQMEPGFYAAPEKLADVANYRAVRWQPMLPGYFVQPLRQGYRFEFVGDGPTDPRLATLKDFGPVYQSFVYAAIPVDPGPARRRSLAIFPDGVVYATAERRVPTRHDTPLGDRDNVSLQ